MKHPSYLGHLGLLAAGVVLSVGALALPARAADWASWRGPEQNGVSRETGLPDHWTPDGENVVWTAPAGGMSSPIVMNGRLYTCTRVGEVPAGEGDNATLNPGPKTQESYVCLDAKTGKLLWHHEENMTQTDAPFHRLGWANPVGDPETGNVYFMGTQCMFLCLDGKDGHVIWRRQLTEEFGIISTFGGRTASPAVDEDQVFISGVSFGWGDHAGSQHRLFAFDKRTGELRWTSGSGGIPVDAPYGTPIFGVINGVRLAILQTGDGKVNAFQSRTGKKVWSFQASKHGWSAAPIIDGNHIYAYWDLDNFDSTKLGRVVCLDAADIVNGSPKELWRIDGIEAGFPSATIHDDTLFVPTDNAIVYAIDTKDGKVKYKRGFGTIGKGSLVYADGKLYFPEANGHVSIFKPGENKFQVLDRQDINDKKGREYNVFGSVAVSDGHIYLQAANLLYCIGPKEFVHQDVTIPPPVNKEEPIDKAAPPPAALLQVVPADVVMHPGQKQAFTVREFDAKGRLIGVAKADQWAIEKLTLPPPPVRPKELMRANSAVAAAGGESVSLDTKPLPPPPPPPPPSSQPVKVGNLLGAVDGQGLFTAADGPLQGGGVVATIGKLTGEARVRVFPALPWKFDFEKDMVNKPPLTWIGAGMKFAVRDMDGNKVLVKLTDIPLFARARTYLGYPQMSNYTIQGDVRVTETVFKESHGEVHKIPDCGVINQRYVLELKGSKQTLGIHVWCAALPRNELDTDLATHKTILFPWKANTWYREKLMVQQEDGKAICKGKVWPADQPEPANWTIELEDSTPCTEGSPGLWGFSNDHEIYYDNIVVTPNQNTQHAEAKP